MNIRQVAAELLRADRPTDSHTRTDRHDEANTRFSLFLRIKSLPYYLPQIHLAEQSELCLPPLRLPVQNFVHISDIPPPPPPRAC